MVLVGVAMVSMWGFTPGLAGGGGGGGLYLDVDPSHPAYPAIKYLVNQGILKVSETGGEFRGDQPLLRYDGAIWLYRAMQHFPQGQPQVDIAGLESRLGDLQSQVSSLKSSLSSTANTVNGLRASVNSLTVQVNNLKAQGATNLSGRVQTNFLLAVTGVILGLGAVVAIVLGY